MVVEQGHRRESLPIRSASILIFGQCWRLHLYSICQVSFSSYQRWRLRSSDCVGWYHWERTRKLIWLSLQGKTFILSKRKEKYQSRLLTSQNWRCGRSESCFVSKPPSPPSYHHRHHGLPQTLGMGRANNPAHQLLSGQESCLCLPRIERKTGIEDQSYLGQGDKTAWKFGSRESEIQT